MFGDNLRARVAVVLLLTVGVGLGPVAVAAPAHAISTSSLPAVAVGSTALALDLPAGRALALPRAAPDTGTAKIDQVVNNLRNWIVGILAALATLFLTIGGLRYLMAAGDPGEIERAKSALRSAAIGYGLAILAPAIVEILKQLVGG